MKKLGYNQATMLGVAAIIAAFAAMGCENELAGDGAAASADASADGDGECTPCPEGNEGPYNTTCCPLKTGGESFDPCFGACGAGLSCDKVAQKCVICSDDKPCTDDSWDVNNNKCVYTNNTATCSDGSACTTDDKCSGGACKGGPALNCDDSDVCTDDSCNPATGCKYINNVAACDDGNVCTTDGKCLAGSCAAGTSLSGGVCDDGDAGTTGDTCIAGTCQGSLPGCDDGDACTVDTGNPCVHTSKVCNDNNPCTDDSCDTDTGCVYTDNTATCEDGSACTTGDKCSGGTCAGGPVLNCNDNNPCTDDSCDTNTGCVYTDNTATCEDGSLCTTDDKCSNADCKGGPALNCDDGKVCTDDSCNFVMGCVNDIIPNCNAVGEVCGNGVDDDGDGAKDCSDSECGAGADAYTLHVFTAGGGTISLMSVAFPGGIDFQLPAHSAGPDVVLYTADDIGSVYFTFACSEIPFAAKVTGNGQTVVWVTSVSYNQQGKPVFDGPPPSWWLPAFWWPWNDAPTLNPVDAPSVVGQSSFQMGQGGSLLVRW